MSEEPKTPAQIVDAMTKDEILKDIAKFFYRQAANRGFTVKDFINVKLCNDPEALQLAEEIIRRYEKE